jgi:agmatinase
MLVDGAHPESWVDPATLDIADIGNFAIAVGDIPASLARIEAQATGLAQLSGRLRCGHKPADFELALSG